MEQLAKNIYQLTLPTPFLVGPVNTYLLEGEALTLVDTGPKTEEALIALNKHLKEKGLTTADIDVVLLTHHHPDHIGLLHEFMPRAKVYAHKKVNPWLTKDRQFLTELKNFYYQLYREHGVPTEIIEKIEKRKTGYMSFADKGSVDNFLREGDMPDGLTEWKVLETPGHAQSHISLYRESDGVMISGDHLIEHISSNAIIEGPYPGETERPKTLLQYRESLIKCQHVNVAYSGHGKAVLDPPALIKSRLEDQDRKAEHFKRLMGQEPVNCFELCKRKYAHILERQPDLTFSETLGHLDLLESREEVKQTRVDGVIYYEVV